VEQTKLAAVFRAPFQPCVIIVFLLLVHTPLETISTPISSFLERSVTNLQRLYYIFNIFGR